MLKVNIIYVETFIEVSFASIKKNSYYYLLSGYLCHLIYTDT